MRDWLHPMLPLLLAAAAVPALPTALRRLVAVLAPAAAMVLVLILPAGSDLRVAVLDLEIRPLHVDALGRLMAFAFTLYAALAGLFAWRETARLPTAAALGLAAGGVGVVLAGDLLWLLLCWEAMTVCATLVIWSQGSPRALAAGQRYVFLHLAGGLCLLAGVVLHLGQGGGTSVATLSLQGPAAWLILVGVALNAGIPPLHAWLPDAYPTASIFGTVFLAAFTTKAAVCVLARLFPGQEVLVWMGAGMAIYGVVFAVLENDIRRLLGYHIISQVGFMVCGVGMGTALALNGAAAHAFCHIFYKGLLLMAAGAVIHATGRGKLTELGQLARPLRWTLVFLMIGAFSISGVPLFSGFISKSMVISAAGETRRGPVELMLLVASMGTFLSIGLKLAWFAFFGPARDPRPRRLVPVPPSMTLAMALTAAACLLLGLFPGLLYAALPHAADYHPYTLDHVLTALQLLLGTALGFWLVRGMLGGKPTITLDVDRLYRRPLALALDTASLACARVCAASEAALHRVCRGSIEVWQRLHQASNRATLAHHVALVALCLVGVWCLVRLV